MPRRSAEYMRSRRLELANAAMRCFQDKGYHATSIPDICREADVSIGTLYKHFDSKRDMWMASFEDRMAAMDDEPLHDDWQEFRDRMVAGIAGLEDRETLGVISSSLEFTADALRDGQYADWAQAVTAKSQDRLTRQLRRLEETGEISLPLGPGVTERMMRSLLFGAVTQYIWENSISAEQINDEIKRTLDHLVNYGR